MKKMCEKIRDQIVVQQSLQTDHFAAFHLQQTLPSEVQTGQEKEHLLNVKLTNSWLILVLGTIFVPIRINVLHWRKTLLVNIRWHFALICILLSWNYNPGCFSRCTKNKVKNKLLHNKEQSITARHLLYTCFRPGPRGITLCIPGELTGLVAVWEMQQTSTAKCKTHFLLFHSKSLLKQWKNSCMDFL